MHDKEIKYFTDGFNQANEKYFVDAINNFQALVSEYPESDLADDALYNIGLCYFEMNQFQKSIEILEKMIEIYPEATITALEGGDAYGKTAAKAYYLIVQCHIGLKDLLKAESILPLLAQFQDTYLLKNESKIYFVDLARQTIERYKQLLSDGGI